MHISNHIYGHVNVIFVQVKDTVQVDYNVSRHLDDELDRTDWKLLVFNLFRFYNFCGVVLFLNFHECECHACMCVHLIFISFRH